MHHLYQSVYNMKIIIRKSFIAECICTHKGFFSVNEASGDTRHIIIKLKNRNMKSIKTQKSYLQLSKLNKVPIVISLF